MEKSPIILKWGSQNHDEENQALFRCSECDETFSKPILATLSSSGQVQTYYACPRCLTKVAEKRSSKSERETSPFIEKVKKTTAIEENDVKCKHFLGYLKNRPKNTPIPDECLTCGKMVECLIH
jgi:DNA-directed RNA polymerase subunit RPC12/RpoP